MGRGHRRVVGIGEGDTGRLGQGGGGHLRIPVEKDVQDLADLGLVGVGPYSLLVSVSGGRRRIEVDAVGPHEARVRQSDCRYLREYGQRVAVLGAFDMAGFRAPPRYCSCGHDGAGIALADQAADGGNHDSGADGDHANAAVPDDPGSTTEKSVSTQTHAVSLYELGDQYRGSRNRSRS